MWICWCGDIFRYSILGFLEFPESTPKNRSELGRRSSTRFTRKVALFFVNSGTPAAHPIRDHRLIAYQLDHGAPVSSTDKPISSKWRILLENDTLDEYTSPRVLETSEVPSIVEEYRLAAINSARAGFDGIEIHGGHGYLIDQFLKESIHNGTDEYGGSIENRCRFLMDIIDATTAVIGVDRVRVRISPAYHHNNALVSDPLRLGLGIIGRINEFPARVGCRLSYLHVTRPRFMGILKPDFTGENERKEARVMRAWRDAYEGTFMSSGGFTRDAGKKELEGGDADLVAYGRLFILNPDLVQRFKKVWATWTTYGRTTFYTSDHVVGYTITHFFVMKSMDHIEMLGSGYILGQWVSPCRTMDVLE